MERDEVVEHATKEEGVNCRCGDVGTAEESEAPASRFQSGCGPVCASSSGALRVELAAGCGAVWDADSVRRLRELRLPGQLSGMLPRAPRQTIQLGLPLLLLPEELHLLRRTGLAEVVQYPALRRPRSPESQRRLQQLDDTSAGQQQRLMTAARHKQILERADCIAAGKLKKLRKTAQDADVTRAQLRHEFVQKLREGVRPPPVEQCYLQMFCGHPLALTPQPAADDEVAPAGQLRRAAYADLWRRGYFLTDGLKFGADFLAYAGDPLVYHAAFLVSCQTGRLPPRQLSGLQRLAQGCGKTLLLSQWDTEGGGVKHTPVSRQSVPLKPLPQTRAAGSDGELRCEGEDAGGGSSPDGAGGGDGTPAATGDGSQPPTHLQTDCCDWLMEPPTDPCNPSKETRTDDWAASAPTDDSFWSSN